MAVTTTSNDVVVPNASSLLLENDGGVVCFVRFGGVVQVATVNDLPVLPGGSLVISAGQSRHVAAVCGSGGTVLRVVGGVGRLWGVVGILGRVVVGVVPPLDVVSGAVGGYGFRRLRSGYVGKAVNVRRSSDSAVQDIGFAGNDFDVASFSSFVGGGSGSVVVWYDQSGGGNDMLAGASAPVVSLGGRPAGVFVDATLMNHGGSPVLGMPLTVSAVAVRTGNFSAYNGIMGDDSGSNYALYFDTSANGVSIFDGGSIGGPVFCTDGVLHCVGAIFAGASSSIYVDGVSTGVVTGSNSFTGLRLGHENGGLTGNLSEALYFGGQLSGGSMAALQANQKAYYGTP